MAAPDVHTARVTRFVGGRPMVSCPAITGPNLELGPTELLTNVPALVQGDRVLLLRAVEGSIVVVGKLA